MEIKISLIIGSLLFTSLSIFAQDKKAAPAKEQSNDSQAAFMAYMTPGPMHKMLASSNGEWQEDITFWMGPDAPPQKEKSKCLNTMIMGDRYQESFHKGSMMGMPFEGRSIIGYDNSKKSFVSSWFDNMGTGIMNMEGKYDEATKSVTLKGKEFDPTSGKDVDVREVMKFTDDKNQTLEMYMTKNGKEFKTMLIKFTKNDIPGKDNPEVK